MKIDKLTLMRTPIVRVLDGVLNLISLGKWGELKRKYSYDQMYHLSLVADIGNKKIMIEKNATINITDKGYSVSSKSEFMPVSLNKDITLEELFNNAKGLWPKEYQMYEYNAFTNNCQIFLRNLLNGSGLLTPEAEGFLFQPLENLAKELPESTKTIAKFTTDLGAVSDKIFRGGRKKEIIL